VNRSFSWKKASAVASLAVLLGTTAGCVYLVVGSLGAVGGYVVSPDTVEGTVERDFEEVWDAAHTVVNIMGRILKESEKEGKLEAIINNCRVNVGIYQMSRSLVKISVEARKSFFPSITTAQDVYVKIMNQME